MLYVHVCQIYTCGHADIFMRTLGSLVRFDVGQYQP